MADALFEIPQSLGEVSEENLKQAQAAYDQLMKFMANAVDAWMEAMPSNPVTAGVKEVHDRVMLFAKDNADGVFAFASRISNAQTLSEILALQTQFAQDRMQALTAQTQELFTLIEDTLQKTEGDVGTGLRSITFDPMAISSNVAGRKEVQGGVRAAR